MAGQLSTRSTKSAPMIIFRPLSSCIEKIIGTIGTGQNSSLHCRNCSSYRHHGISFTTTASSIIIIQTASKEATTETTKSKKLHKNDDASTEIIMRHNIICSSSRHCTFTLLANTGSIDTSCAASIIAGATASYYRSAIQ